jgi:uncharacterized protein
MKWEVASLKVSRFTHFLRDGMVYNCVSLGYGRLTPVGMAIIKWVQENGELPKNADEQTIKELRRGSIIVPDELDEVAALRVRSNRARFDRTTFGLTILPTLDCNFRCTYCYETRKRSRMTTETADAVLALAEKSLSGISRLSVTWYGGEPLLERETVLKTQGAIRRLAQEAKVPVKTLIVTNGYLLTEETARELKELGVGSAQVTIDGPKEVHDRRRSLANGDGTYDVIVRNITRASEHLGIGLRINVDRGNSSAVADWLPELSRLCRGRAIRPYFAPVKLPRQHANRSLGSATIYKASPNWR